MVIMRTFLIELKKKPTDPKIKEGMPLIDILMDMCDKAYNPYGLGVIDVFDEPINFEESVDDELFRILFDKLRKAFITQGNEKKIIEKFILSIKECLKKSKIIPIRIT